MVALKFFASLWRKGALALAPTVNVQIHVADLHSALG